MDAGQKNQNSLELKIRLGGIEPESIVDGPGFRCTIFVQGCHLGCHGCHNPELQDPGGGRLEEISGIIQQYFTNPLISGLTLSGGEPFNQAQACTLLAQGARQRGLSVFCYTGYTFETLTRGDQPDWNELLRWIDVLVDGPFEVENRDLSLDWRGSSNQRLLDVPCSLLLGKPVQWVP